MVNTTQIEIIFILRKPIIIFRHKTHNSIIKNPNTNIDNNNVPANFPLSSMTTLS